MLERTLLPCLLFCISALIFFGCTKSKTSPEFVHEELDTAKYKIVDSLTNEVPRSALRDTILTITDDSVYALYAPNTGKVVMKLAKGDVCNITRTGRYDVIEGRGNFWVRVEHFGGKGWIFGGQTSLKSDIWVFGDGMTQLGHPYNKYNLGQLRTSGFDEFYRKFAQAIKKSEYSENKEEEEFGFRKVEIGDDEIVVTEDDGLGTTLTETFKSGPANDSLQSLIYTYSGKGDFDLTYSHSFIVAKRGTSVTFVADFFGELKDIYKMGKNYLLISEYDLFSGRLGTIHYTNVELYSPAKKQVISRHRFANSAVEITGYPIFKAWDDGSFIANSKASFSKTDGVLTMEIFETYNRIKPNGEVEEKVTYITRYFTFNDSTQQFDESRQEVIYQAK